jgi:hypothetical protein
MAPFKPRTFRRSRALTSLARRHSTRERPRSWDVPACTASTPRPTCATCSASCPTGRESASRAVSPRLARHPCSPRRRRARARAGAAHRPAVLGGAAVRALSESRSSRIQPDIATTAAEDGAGAARTRSRWASPSSCRFLSTRRSRPFVAGPAPNFCSLTNETNRYSKPYGFS